MVLKEALKAAYNSAPDAAAPHQCQSNGNKIWLFYPFRFRKEVNFLGLFCHVQRYKGGLDVNLYWIIEVEFNFGRKLEYIN